MTASVQEILVYLLFALAIAYFTYRFYVKNRKRKTAGQAGESCKSGDCGCG